MQPSDTQGFFDVWDQCAEVYGKPVSDAAKELVFKLLARYSLADVKAALRAHMLDPQHGQFMPKPADIIRQFQQISSNQFPGPEQAWAMFPKHETESACICVEMGKAWGVAVGLDEIPARMAFKETYAREVAQATAKGRSPDWYMSMGHDPSQRDQAVIDAIEQGLLGVDSAKIHLPHIPSDEIQLLIDHKISASKLLENHAQTVSTISQLKLPAAVESTPEEAKAHLAKLRELVA